jgi:hypothetical protein
VLQFPAGTRDLFSSRKHPRQLGGGGGNPPPFEWVSGPLSRAGGVKLTGHETDLIPLCITKDTNACKDTLTAPL